MSHDILYLSAEGEHRLPGAAGSRAQAPIGLVADFVEEAAVRAALPRMRGRDMQALVTRRLEQEFRETAYRTAWRLGPGRAPKTADWLFLGLPLAHRLDARLASLAQEGRAVSGVWTVGLLVADWLRRTRVRAPALLVVLPTPAGIRHVFLENGQPVLSRLTSVPNEPGAAAAELERTVHYLYNARLVERGLEIPAWLWGQGTAQAIVVDRTVAGLRFEPGPSARTGEDPAREGLDALLRMASRRPPALQLAPDTVRLRHIAAQTRRTLAWVAGLATVGLLGMAAVEFSATQRYRSEMAALRADIARQQAEVDAIRVRQAGLVDVDAQTVREAVAAHDAIVAAAPSFGNGLALASLGFERSPAYQLDELHWALADAGMAAGEPAAQDADACPPAPVDDGSGAPVPITAGMTLYGELPTQLSVRDAMAARRAFEAAFAGRADARLVGRKTPVDTSGGAIRGGGEAEDGDRAFAYCLHWSPHT